MRKLFAPITSSYSASYYAPVFIVWAVRIEVASMFKAMAAEASRLAKIVFMLILLCF